MTRPSAITTPQLIACPHCATAIAEVTASGIRAIGREFFLDDGDAIPHAQALSPPPDRVTECMLSVGKCQSCTKGYFMVEATFVDGTVDNLYDWMAGSLEEREPPQWQMVPDAAGPAWIHARTMTRNALVIDEHLFGPYPVDLAVVIGPHGVSACGARAQNEPWLQATDVLHKHWPALLQHEQAFG